MGTESNNIFRSSFMEALKAHNITIADSECETLYRFTMKQTLGEFFFDMPEDAIGAFDRYVVEQNREQYFRDHFEVCGAHAHDIGHVDFESAIDTIHAHFRYAVLETIIGGYKIIAQSHCK